MTTWRLKQATEENQQYRIELGYLDVTDEERIHALQMPTVESMLWKWKVHLPPGRRGTLHVATHNVPASGFPGGSSIGFAPSDEPITITVALRRDHLDHWQVVATERGSTIRIGISDEDADWLIGGNSSSSGVMFGKTQSFDPDKPVELLRLRAHKPLPGGASAPPDAPSQGILIWLEAQ
jgi:hypothetical protein